MDVLAMFSNSKMQFMLCTINIQYAACIAFWVSNFMPFMASTMPQEWTNNQKNEQGFYALIALAGGSIAGSLLLGIILDKFGPKPAIYCILCVSVSVTSASIAYNEKHVFNVWAYVISFGWGVMDACLINMLNNLMGFEFKSKVTPFAA